VERGADLVVVRMPGIVDDPLPLVVVPMKALAVPVVVGQHVLDEVVERLGKLALRVERINEELPFVFEGRLWWLERVVQRRDLARGFPVPNLEQNAPAVAAGLDAVRLAQQVRAGKKPSYFTTVIERDSLRARSGKSWSNGAIVMVDLLAR
jgi:hypothetical protein